MTAPAANDFLLGASGAGKSASFLQLGASITGTITAAPEVRQQMDDDGKPKTWENGDPQWQIVVSLQTDQRKPDLPDDDGIRFLYVKGSRKPESKSMHAAVAGAVQAAGAKGLEVGGVLTVTYVADGEKSSPLRNAPKKYTASYVPAANAALMGTEQSATASVPAQTVPAQAQPAETTAPAGHDPALLAAIAHLSQEQQNAVLAAPGMTAAMATAMFPKAG